MQDRAFGKLASSTVARARSHRHHEPIADLTCISASGLPARFMGITKMKTGLGRLTGGRLIVRNRYQPSFGGAVSGVLLFLALLL